LINTFATLRTRGENPYVGNGELSLTQHCVKIIRRINFCEHNDWRRATFETHDGEALEHPYIETAINGHHDQDEVDIGRQDLDVATIGVGSAEGTRTRQDLGDLRTSNTNPVTGNWQEVERTAETARQGHLNIVVTTDHFGGSAVDNAHPTGQLARTDC